MNTKNSPTTDSSLSAPDHARRADSPSATTALKSQNPLKAYYAKKALRGIPSLADARDQIESLLACMDDTGRVNVAKFLEAQKTASPFVETESINRSLLRLVKKINAAAQEAGVTFEASIVGAKKDGAAKRWVCFYGPPPTPNAALTPELDSIPSDQRYEPKGNHVLGDLPVVALMTFNSIETDAVLNQFAPKTTTPTLFTLDNVTCLDLGEHNGLRIIQCTSSQGQNAAQQTATALIAAIGKTQLKAIIGVGIAAGIAAEGRNLGDVLVIEDAYDYELRKEAQTTEPRGGTAPTSFALRQLFRAVDDAKRSEAKWPTVHFGRLLSGNAVIDNKEILEKFCNRAGGKVIGVEMESLGLYYATEPDKIDWITVKGICDWADGTKNAPGVNKDEDQKQAAENAALVVYEALHFGSLYPPESPPPSSSSPFTPGRRPDLNQIRIPKESTEHDIPLDQLLLLRAAWTNMAKDDIGRQSSPAKESDGISVLKALKDWAKETASPHFFALLGEYGMGKTVTCQHFFEQLKEQRIREPATTPLPLYFDLRNVTGLDSRVPTLAQVLEECIERGWLDHNGVAKLTQDELYTSIESVPVIFIFDGLDEALVKLNEQDGQALTRNLLKVCDDIEARRKDKALAPCPVKVLVSCRTHFFRTLRDQKNHFTGQERGNRQANAWSSMVLLPLNEAQVTAYLKGAFPELDTEKLLATIASVHNLAELSQRPITLRWLKDFLPEIENKRMGGKTVYGITLYRDVVLRWLERDSGKHQISKKEHKMKLAMHLAAYLWGNGNGSMLSAEKIEDWLHAWLESEPTLKRRYAHVSPDQLEEDLRNSTFLARQDGRNGSNFRFAHTSLLEFFLSQYLFTALEENAPERWQLPYPSEETLDFFGQTLAEANNPQHLRRLNEWGQLPPSAASGPTNTPAPLPVFLLRYTLHARKKGWPAPSLQNIQLQNARLDEEKFIGTAENRLDLRSANFAGSELRRTVWEHVLLDAAQLQNTTLTQTTFDQCSLQKTDWSHAACDGAKWHVCDLTDSQWKKATGKQPEFLFCQGVSEKRLDRNEFASPQILHDANTRKRISEILRFNNFGDVRSCSWSPDGQRLLAGGWSGLAIYNAQTGNKELEIKDAGTVDSCSWSPDGQRVLAAGEFGLAMYNARTGNNDVEIKVNGDVQSGSSTVA
jgi:nucleoside phosphorylase